jgi:hypothetical protein
VRYPDLPDSLAYLALAAYVAWYLPAFGQRVLRFLRDLDDYLRRGHGVVRARLTGLVRLRRRYVGYVSSTRELRKHIDVLTEFERWYRSYIEAQEAENSFREPELSHEQRTELRRSLLRRVDAAERAMRHADKMIRVEPPAFYGGPVLTALSDQIFAHETPRYGGTEGRQFDLPNGLLDTMCAALGALEDQLNEAEEHDQLRREVLPKVQAEMDQAQARASERFAAELEEVPELASSKSANANADRSPWYHNPWVVTIGGTVIAGVILALILGTP